MKAKKVSELFPVFNGIEGFNSLIESEKRVNESIEQHKINLKSLRQRLISLYDNDFIVAEYKSIIENSIYGIYSEDEYIEIAKKAEERYKNKIPPGYKDKGKFDGGIGDYIIWSNILDIGESLDKDIVFVSNEKKPDWVITDGNNNVLYAKRELIEEFYERCKKSFKFVTPLELVEKLRPEINEEIKEDLNLTICVSGDAHLRNGLIISPPSCDSICIDSSGSRWIVPRGSTFPIPSGGIYPTPSGGLCATPSSNIFGINYFNPGENNSNNVIVDEVKVAAEESEEE